MLLFTEVIILLQVDLSVPMMNFDGLDAGMGEYSPSLHGTLDAGMEPSMDPHLNPSLLQGVELDPEGLAVTVPESVHLMEGMFSELHSAVSEVGIPVTATHFDLQEEMLWMGNHRVSALIMMEVKSETCRLLPVADTEILCSHVCLIPFYLFPLGSCNLVLRTYHGPPFFFPSSCSRRHPTHSEFGNRRPVPFQEQSQMPHSWGPCYV